MPVAECALVHPPASNGAESVALERGAAPEVPDDAVPKRYKLWHGLEVPVLRLFFRRAGGEARAQATSCAAGRRQCAPAGSRAPRQVRSRADRAPGGRWMSARRSRSVHGGATNTGTLGELALGKSQGLTQLPHAEGDRCHALSVRASPMRRRTSAARVRSSSSWRRSQPSSLARCSGSSPSTRSTASSVARSWSRAASSTRPRSTPAKSSVPRSPPVPNIARGAGRNGRAVTSSSERPCQGAPRDPCGQEGADEEVEGDARVPGLHLGHA